MRLQMLSRAAGLLRQCEAAPEALAPASRALQALGTALRLPPALEQHRCAAPAVAGQQCACVPCKIGLFHPLCTRGWIVLCLAGLSCAAEVSCAWLECGVHCCRPYPALVRLVTVLLPVPRPIHSYTIRLPSKASSLGVGV